MFERIVDEFLTSATKAFGYAATFVMIVLLVYGLTHKFILLNIGAGMLGFRILAAVIIVSAVLKMMLAFRRRVAAKEATIDIVESIMRASKS